MDRRLIRYYDRELRHLQSTTKEFAREFPKIAGRLAIEDFPCADPYVERLLEGFAFLAARVQLKIDAEFPRFTQNLIETAYPHYLAPTPSMAVVQFTPDPAEAGLADGFTLKRGMALRSLLAKGDLTACDYRTADDLTLWPVEVVQVQYYTRDMAMLELGSLAVSASAGRRAAAKAALRVRLRATANLTFDKIRMDTFTAFIAGGDATAGKLYEELVAHGREVLVRPVPPEGAKAGPPVAILPPETVRPDGFRAAQGLLPYDARSFQGYRLLHEYFAFPQRFMFLRFQGLRAALAACPRPEIDLVILLDHEETDLDDAVGESNFMVHCVPAVNLFPKRADRILISDRANEFQIIPDRTRPLDFEVYRVTSVTGIGGSLADEYTFKPFYAATDEEEDSGRRSAYFSLHRVPRAVSEREQRMGRRSSYGGSEVYISLVDASAAPYSVELKQLSVETLCTNRDLPLHMPVGKGVTDFNIEIAAPIKSIRVRAGPTSPRASHAEGEVSWRLISHLSANYLTLLDTDERQGAAALRDLLRLYGDTSQPFIRKQVEGVRGVTARPIVRRVPAPGPITFARGLEITVTLDDAGFEGTGAFVFGSVLEQFFARYVTVNSFTETVLRTADRGEIMRWTASVGHRPVF